jgi:superfamily II DNA/RNA helicase
VHLLAEVSEFKLGRIEMLIVDEADRLFEMGFALQLHEIFKQVPETRQTLLFSATMPRQVRTAYRRCQLAFIKPVFVLFHLNAILARFMVVDGIYIVIYKDTWSICARFAMQTFLFDLSRM